MKESTVPAKQTEAKAPATRDETRTLIPAVDIFEIDDGLAVVADLPGVDKESVSVHVDNGVLTIKGRTKSALPGQPVHSEFRLLDFFRQFELTEEIDQDKIRADMKYGVLTIRLPKVEKARPKRIAVNVQS